jgi:hypothetical protein
MSRYDLDHDPDELRSESVRKPQESSGDHEMFNLRGQGSSSGGTTLRRSCLPRLYPHRMRTLFTQRTGLSHAGAIYH